jgi:hypothetical protein
MLLFRAECHYAERSGIFKNGTYLNALHSDCSGESPDVNVLPHFIYSHQTSLFINLFQLLFVSHTTLYNRPIL